MAHSGARNGKIGSIRAGNNEIRIIRGLEGATTRVGPAGSANRPRGSSRQKAKGDAIRLPYRQNQMKSKTSRATQPPCYRRQAASTSVHRSLSAKNGHMGGPTQYHRRQKSARLAFRRLIVGGAVEGGINGRRQWRHVWRLIGQARMPDAASWPSTSRFLPSSPPGGGGRHTKPDRLK